MRDSAARTRGVRRATYESSYDMGRVPARPAWDSDYHCALQWHAATAAATRRLENLCDSLRVEGQCGPPGPAGSRSRLADSEFGSNFGRPESVRPRRREPRPRRRRSRARTPPGRELGPGARPAAPGADAAAAGRLLMVPSPLPLFWFHYAADVSSAAGRGEGKPPPGPLIGTDSEPGARDPSQPGTPPGLGWRSESPCQ